MAKGSGSADKVKRIALLALGGVLVVVVIYQAFLKAPTPRTRLKAQPGTTSNGNSASATTTAREVPQIRQASAAAEEEALLQAKLSDLTPLNLSVLTRAATGSEPSSRRSIFAYYVPPPAPPREAPPPPPIQLSSVQPSSVVAGTPRTVTLVVRGNKIPADAQILLNGAPKPTKRVNDNQLSTMLAPSDYTSEQTMRVEVKSQSNPAENSNEIQFVVQRAPEPQFIFKGRLGALNQPQTNYAVFELTSTKEIKRAKVGETLMGTWRIDAISADAVDVTHIQYDIKKRVTLQEKPK